MAFHHTYLVDPATGLDIQIKNLTSMAGRVVLHDVGVVTLTMPVESAGLGTGAMSMYRWMYSGVNASVVRTLKVFTIDDTDSANPIDIESETFYLNSAQIDLGAEASDTFITFTGYYCPGRLRRADLPYLLPGESPYLVLPTDADGTVQPLTAGQIVQMALNKIQANGNLTDVQLQLNGDLPLIVLENSPAQTFLDFLNGMVSSKSITWRFSEGRTGAVLAIFPWFEAGIDRPIEFNRGSVTEAVQSQVSAENLITRLTVLGKNADIWRGSNDSTAAALGYIVDKSVQRQDLFTAAMVEDWGRRTLEQESSTVPSYSCSASTVYLPNLWVVGRDFEIGDTVSVFFDGENRYRLRVESCDKIVTHSGDHVTYQNLQLGRAPRDVIPIRGVTDPKATTTTPPVTPPTTDPTNPNNPGGNVYPGDSGGGGGTGGDSELPTSGNGVLYRDSTGPQDVEWTRDPSLDTLLVNEITMTQQNSTSPLMTINGSSGTINGYGQLSLTAGETPGESGTTGVVVRNSDVSSVVIFGNGATVPLVPAPPTASGNGSSFDLFIGQAPSGHGGIYGQSGPLIRATAWDFVASRQVGQDSQQVSLWELKEAVDILMGGGGGTGPSYSITPTTVSGGRDWVFTVVWPGVPEGTIIYPVVDFEDLSTSGQADEGHVYDTNGSAKLYVHASALVAGSRQIQAKRMDTGELSPAVTITVTAESNDGSSVSPASAYAGSDKTFVLTWPNLPDGTNCVLYWDGDLVEGTDSQSTDGAVASTVSASLMTVRSHSIWWRRTDTNEVSSPQSISVTADPGGIGAGGHF